MKIHEITTELASRSSSNERIALLKENMSPLLIQIWEDTYNPGIKYYMKGLAPSNERSMFASNTIDQNYDVFHGVLQNVATRFVTGDRAKDLVRRTIESFVPEDQQVLCNIVNRNMLCGVNLSNFRKAAGLENVSKKFEVALASKLQDVNVDVLDGNWFSSRKLDGLRLITFIDKEGSDVDVRFFSRVGKEFTTMGVLEQHVRTLSKYLPQGSWVLDGEVCVIDEDGTEHFDQIVEQARRKDYTIPNPTYMVFDMISRAAFEGREESLILSGRYDRLGGIISQYFENTGDTHIQMLNQERITSQADFDRWSQMVRDNGWEGFMLRKNGPYESGRLKTLLKVKKFQDAEYVVQGVTTGPVTYNDGGYKQVDAVTSLVIEHKGNRVEVGSGISKEQRMAWYADPSLIIGKTITVQYFQETIDKKKGTFSLRFPVLKYVYDGDRDC